EVLPGDPLQRLGEVEDVVIGLVRLAEGSEQLDKPLLGGDHVVQGQPELHVLSAIAGSPPAVVVPMSLAGAEAVFVGAGAGPPASPTLTTSTAPALNSGCLEAGSQPVIVSSLAARESSCGR